MSAADTDYDNRVFRSTETDPASGQSPVGRYHQQGDLVWAEFAGAHLRTGRLVGTRRPDGTIDAAYCQVTQSGTAVAGTVVSTPTVLPDGRLRLTERWRRADGSTGVSHIEEQPGVGDRPVVVVDPFSTGRELAPTFAARGVRTIAVLTEATPADVYAPAWEAGNFEHIFVWNGRPEGVDSLVELLRPLSPAAILPGCEVAAGLADALAARLTPWRGNDPATSIIRRDKWEMARACAAAGIPILRQLRTADPEEAAAWIAEAGLADRPLVLKPPMSAGTDDVHFVPAGGDWRGPFQAVLGHTNAINGFNDAVLVQEFADGVEYLIDTYSAGGVHGLVDVCRYTKAASRDADGSVRIGLYDRVDFLPPDSPEIPELIEYVRRVADAVGIRDGCGHAEVMLTADGPRLMEIAARPAGGGHQLVSRLATGDCHVDRTVRHVVSGEFRVDFDWVQHVRAAFLASPRTGVWRNGDLFDQVDSLPTFHSKNIPFTTGDTVPQTLALAEALGWVILADPSEEAVEADYAKLKELEAMVFVD